MVRTIASVSLVLLTYFLNGCTAVLITNNIGEDERNDMNLKAETRTKVGRCSLSDIGCDGRLVLFDDELNPWSSALMGVTF